MKHITICSSMNFYKHVNGVADILREKGFKISVPHRAEIMKQTGDYEAEDIRTWMNNPDDFSIKRELMDKHFEKVADSDAILIVNDQKRGINGYIGANALMEMAIAYYLKKAIYVLNDVPKDNPVYEEVLGMGCIILSGDLDKIK